MAKYTISHYGVARRSGRYPWGSGDDPEQRNRSFIGTVNELKKKGLSEKELSKGLGISSTELRRRKSLVSTEKKQSDLALAIRLKEKGLSNVEIGKRMNRNESSIRAMLKNSTKDKNQVTDNVADVLRKALDSGSYVDVGVGVERYMGVKQTRLRTAVLKLQDEGYVLHETKVEQLGTGKYTRILALTPKGTTFGDLIKNKDKIKMATEYSEDDGYTFLGLEPVKSIDSKRVQIRYAEDGGINKDGVIELRRGVPDISLGGSNYAQVRVGVDNTHYMKGMAIYSDNMPKGVDIIYNTNKTKSTPKEKVFKEMKTTLDGKLDTENPFGATVKQRHYIDSKGQKQLSTLNIVNEEGDWGKWSKSISSQVLSKQSTSLAKTQLDIAYNIKKEEFDSINGLTNPIVKKKLLESFSDDADSASVHLKAAALPRQAAQVLIPFPSMNEKEIYAPNFNNGEKVVLIRYPHGGIFEIPELTVNNKQKDARNTIPQAKDAVGINNKVAELLSGADFDGDTVLVIPNNKGLIKRSSPLEGLKNFDPKIEYKYYDGMSVMSKKATGMQMGLISNLITDMTIKGANEDELSRAVRHSMVVIDAEKHKLDYKQSYNNNGIAQLKKKYQGTSRGGATTLISKAKSRIDVPERSTTYKINPETGEKIYRYTNKTTTSKQGVESLKTIRSTKMFETDDAFKLSSGTPIESVYANHANKLKALANEARKIAINTKPLPDSKSAKQIYANEIQSLDVKLNIALKNSPLERRAQLISNSIYNTKKANLGELEEADKKKLKSQALATARARVNPNGKTLVDPTEKEWEAIQSGAISTNKLKQILDNTDIERIKQLATPKSKVTLSSNQEKQAKLMLSSGYTQSEIASRLAVSTSLISELIQ